LLETTVIQARATVGAELTRCVGRAFLFGEGSSTDTWRPISPARRLTAGINAAAAVRWQRARGRLALDPVAGGGPR